MTPETDELLDRSATVRERAEDAIRHAAHLSHEAHLLKSLAEDAVEDGIHSLKRSARKARNRAIDGRDEIVYRVKREPLIAVALAFGVGAALGLASGYLGGRRSVQRLVGQ